MFIDPVGTGYSRAKTVEIARRMNGVQGDIQSVGEFMRMYIIRNSRELSPLFIAGESYGTFRAAGLAGYLIDRGIAFNGVVLIGTTLNLETIWSRSDDLVYELELPTYAADAWYHKKVAADLQRKDLKSFLKEAEAFASGEYATALIKGDQLSPAERKATIDKLVRYTGLEARYVDENNLRWDVQHFTRELLRDQRKTIGRYDGRLTSPAPLDASGDGGDSDPSSTLITPPFTAILTNYLRVGAGIQDRHVLLSERRRAALGLRRAERIRRHHRHAAQRLHEESVHEGDDRRGILRPGDSVSRGGVHVQPHGTAPGDAPAHHLGLLPGRPHAVYRQRFPRQAEARFRRIPGECATQAGHPVESGLMRTLRPALAALLFLGLAAAQEITTPEKFFGFQLGADKKMARWDKIVEYYGVLEKQSGGRMKVINMGPTSEGNPFLMVIITSPANFAKLDRLREVNLRLSDPRGLTEAQAHALVDEGKAVIVQSMSMHATEIGGTQMAPELAYDLLARKDEETRRILDNVIFIEVPCFNPDGEIMVTDWYNKQLGTPYEGTNPPWLYQKYAGHDNNRDAFQTNIPDSQYMAKILFTDWRPEAYVDHHGMGGNGARIFLPPYAEPIRPFADPILWRELSWYGAHMAYKEEEAGSLRRHQRRHLFRLGPLRLSLDHAVPQHRRHAHRVGRRAPGDAAVRASRPVARQHPQPAGVRGRDHLPQPVAGRLVAPARHRGPAEGFRVGHARPGRAQSRNGALERLSEGQAPDRARRRRQARPRT